MANRGEYGDEEGEAWGRRLMHAKSTRQIVLQRYKEYGWMNPCSLIVCFFCNGNSGNPYYTNAIIKRNADFDSENKRDRNLKDFFGFALMVDERQVLRGFSAFSRIRNSNMVLKYRLSVPSKVSLHVGSITILGSKTHRWVGIITKFFFEKRTKVIII